MNILNRKRAFVFKNSELEADNVYAWAKEQIGEVSHEIFEGWMLRNGLSLTKAAEALGMSRRMVSYYRTEPKAFLRHIWLGCPGWEVMGGMRGGFGGDRPFPHPLSMSDMKNGHQEQAD